ncbi:molybdenum cofactor biosynthesis protein [Candidatus Sumerlaeota bacterium]|nr:molybdenum cofactor biosynthesis protein [Candidatus Sumerlaeota bacterium]
MQGSLAYICIGKAKGTGKTAVGEAALRAEHGIEGDAHAGSGHRQVSLLDVADIEELKQRGLAVMPGAFGENLGVRDLPFAEIGLGSRLCIGASAELMISQIGKQCHSPCAIYAAAGDCIMPRVGLFAKVVSDGRIRQGDAVVVLEKVDRALFQAVVLTISDSCSRGEAQDTAGPAVVALLSGPGCFHVYRQKILPDEKAAIEGDLRHYADGHSLDLILTVGGTGFSPRDVTPEATRSVIERLAPGLDEAMRAAALKATPLGILSRGVSGIRGATLIVNLPGSTKAAAENLSAILPALPHALAKLRGDPAECAPARRNS